MKKTLIEVGDWTVVFAEDVTYVSAVEMEGRYWIEIGIAGQAEPVDCPFDTEQEQDTAFLKLKADLRAALSGAPPE